MILCTWGGGFLKLLILFLTAILVLVGYAVTSPEVDHHEFLSRLSPQLIGGGKPEVFIRKSPAGENAKIFKLSSDQLYIEVTHMGPNLYHCQEYISLDKKKSNEGECGYIENFKPVPRTWEYKKTRWYYSVHLVNSLNYRRKGYFNIYFWTPAKSRKPIKTDWFTIY